MLTIKVKLKLNKKQTANLTRLSLQLTKLHNDLLQYNFSLIEAGQKYLTHFQMVMFCKGLKIAEGVATDIVSDLCKRVHSNLNKWQKSENLKLKFWLQHGVNYNLPLTAYLKKANSKMWGKPRFKNKGTTVLFSIRKRDQSFIKTFGKQTSISVPNIGRIKGYNDRQEQLGTATYTSIKRDKCKTWWAGIVCDGERHTTIKSKAEAIGVDLGLKHTVTAANEKEVIQPIRNRFLDKQLKALKTASNGDRRALPFIYRKITRRRKHSHHVLAKQLIEAADKIYVGNLNSRWLISGSLARSALDAAHCQFKQILNSKAENAGKKVILVNEAFTSQTCYSCGSRKKMELSDRTYSCDTCGYIKDRDVNGAFNIMKIGEGLRLEV